MLIGPNQLYYKLQDQQLEACQNGFLYGWGAAAIPPKAIKPHKTLVLVCTNIIVRNGSNADYI